MPSRSQEEILMALHENDYDVSSTVDFLLEGKQLSQDWKTVGAVKAKKSSGVGEEGSTEAPNESQPQTQGPQSRNRQSGGRGKGEKSTRFDDRQNRPPRSKKAETPTNEDTNIGGLEDRVSNMEIKEDSKQGEENDDRLNNRRRQRGSYSGRGRGGGRGGRGGGGGGISNLDRPYRRNNRTELGNQPLEHVNEEINSNPNDNINNNNNIEFESNGVEMNHETNETKPKAFGDNLRDIGTWSNEQADHRQQQLPQRHRNYNRNNNTSNHRVNNNNNNLNSNMNKNGNEEFENDEEWQGDLTQTQIFISSSAQKKEIVEPM